VAEKEKRTEKETYEKPELKKEGDLKDITAGKPSGMEAVIE